MAAFCTELGVQIQDATAQLQRCFPSEAIQWWIKHSEWSESQPGSPWLILLVHPR
eukprot:SAG31_NODE_39566_length_287_cov_0.824468_1_plen_54_part_01